MLPAQQRLEPGEPVRSEFDDRLPEHAQLLAPQGLVQVGLDPQDELTKMGVPTIWTFVTDAADRRVAELVVSQQVFQRSYIMPPGTPDDRVAAIRAAFVATMKDPAFLDEANRSKLEISPVSAEEQSVIVGQMFNASADVLAAAKAAME